MRRVRCAVVGCGFVARTTYLPALAELPEAEVVAVADVDEAAARGAQAEAGAARRYGDIDELLASEDVDVLANCTPPSAHAAIVRSAIAHSVDVFCEKPLAIDVAEARSLVAAARRSGVRLGVAPDVVLRPALRTLAGVVTAGDIGVVHTVYGRYGIDVPPETTITRPWYYGDGGGVLFDHALYLVTACISLFGLANRVYAGTKTVVPDRVGVDGSFCVAAEDAATMMIGFDGPIATLQAAFVYGGAAELRFDVFGTVGTLSLSGSDWMSCVLVHRTRTKNGPRARVLEYDRASDVDGLTEFIRARIARRESALRSDDALHALEVVAAARESARAQDVVMLDNVSTEIAAARVRTMERHS